MNARWFRMYDEVLDDPKVQKLSGDDFKAWVNLLALASRHDGRLPDLEAVAFALRIDLIAAGSLADRLRIAGLFDTRKGGANGSYIAPHGWEKRQYKSDTSTERVKRFRNAAKAVSETAPETPPDTDTDTEVTVDKSTVANATPNAVPPDPLKQLFDRCVAMLAASGVPASQARSLTGKWRRDYGDGVLIEAITDCQTRGVTNPVEWLAKALPARVHRQRITAGFGAIEDTRPVL